MVARYAGASLGLFAFAIAVFGGMAARNPFAVTLSRGILALFVFCLIGLVLGHMAQRVVTEHAQTREAELRARFAPETDAAVLAAASPPEGSSSTPARS